MKRTETKTTTKQDDSVKLELIQKEYASILVHQMLSNDDAATVLSARSRLKFYDDKLRQMGLRATIKVGTEKIA